MQCSLFKCTNIDRFKRQISKYFWQEAYNVASWSLVACGVAEEAAACLPDPTNSRSVRIIKLIFVPLFWPKMYQNAGFCTYGKIPDSHYGAGTPGLTLRFLASTFHHSDCIVSVYMASVRDLIPPLCSRVDTFQQLYRPLHLYLASLSVWGIERFSILSILQSSVMLSNHRFLNLSIGRMPRIGREHAVEHTDIVLLLTVHSGYMSKVTNVLSTNLRQWLYQLSVLLRCTDCVCGLSLYVKPRIFLKTDISKTWSLLFYFEWTVYQNYVVKNVSPCRSLR